MRASLVLALLAVAVARAAVEAQAPPGAAVFVRSIQQPSDRRETRSDILDTPVLPGSFVKAVTLVTALERGVVRATAGHVCRRVVTVDGRRYVCSHPDLKRPMTPAEALAHSCNDFFVSAARLLTRDQINQTRLDAGLPPLGPTANVAASAVGLDGPRVTPRALIDVLARLTGRGADRAMPMADLTRRTLIEGLAGAAQHGTAAAFGQQGLSALAKTGTVPMPGGASMGLVVALIPAGAPTHGIVVVAPGAAGQDAAAIAADELARRASGTSDARDTPPAIRLGVTQPNGRTRIESLPLDEYVAQVVAGEGQPSAADAAQQALAVTARTFAVANLNRHRREGFDLCDTTHCQVVRPATPASRRAAQGTAARVLMHEGHPASVFYSALCGGHSELASEVWPGAADYVERSRADEACRDEPAWTSELRVDQIEQALRAAGFRGDRLRSLRILQRNASGRVSRLRIEGFTPSELSGHDFRMAVGRAAGWQQMKSTAFDVRRTSAGYAFRGQGFGHGVGLCVIGAGRRAASGTTAAEILRFYFPTLSVATLSGAALASAASTPPPPPVVAPSLAPVRDVLLAVPAAEEGERARLLQIIRAARDQVAARASVRAPATVRVTVHPTVEAFGRATGQPWWVSGTTDGNSVELLPLAVLRQRGQLERTIRHELAHVLVDAALDGRPLWVREGAAAYFADPDAVVDLRARTSCPTDEEFLRPLSAGSHRTAYLRAEVCFRRAMADGRRWTEVGR